MFGSEVLDIVIGMVFVYFLLSLLSLTLAEVIARVFALRSATLYDAIRRLLTDPKIGSSDLFEKFWKHPLIATLAPEGEGWAIGEGRGKTSYIPAELFAVALLDVIDETAPSDGTVKTAVDVRSAADNLKGDQLKRLLLALIGVDSNLQQAQMELAKWFDQYMDRVSGWYKRKSQNINLALALGLTIILNTDSLAIYSALSANPQLRAAAVAVATDYVQKHPSPELTPTQPLTDTTDLVEPVTQIINLQHTLASLNLPITWAPAKDKVPTDVMGWFYKILGLLITAILVSLGAPFWFDLLNKFVNLRSTGKVPDKVTDTSPDSGKTPPRNDATTPVAEKPSPPSADLERLMDRAAQIVAEFKTSGRVKSRAEEDDAAIRFLKPEAARRGWSITEEQLFGAWAAYERRRTT